MISIKQINEKDVDLCYELDSDTISLWSKKQWADEFTLRNSCRAYKKALEKYYPGESLPIYASKANSSIFMSNLVSSEGLGLDAVSEGELLTALKGGVPNEKIVFHGNNKSDKEIDFAIRNDIKIIVDNDYDLR